MKIVLVILVSTSLFVSSLHAKALSPEVYECTSSDMRSISDLEIALISSKNLLISYPYKDRSSVFGDIIKESANDVDYFNLNEEILNFSCDG